MNLSDEQWRKVAVFLDNGVGESERGRPAVSSRRIFEAILWIREHDEQWKHLPSCFPSQQTCYNRWLKWRKTGALDAALKMIGSCAG
jgi:transposase